jgi:hypothetical protein
MSNYSPKNYNVWECENIFFLKSHPSRINKFLAHYELYKKIINLPGSIVECGVYKGASLMRWAHFRQSLENNESRHIYGFDAFGSFPKKGLKSSLDKRFVDEYDDGGGVGISVKKLENFYKKKKFSNIQLIKGNVLSTLEKFKKNNQHLKIALLHLDMDVYEPTLHALKVLSKNMIKGGLIIIDDYATVEGATRAVDDFCKKDKRQIKKLPFYLVPSYIEI